MAGNHMTDPGDGMTMVDTPAAQMANHNPAVGVLATITAPAVPGQRNVCHSITACIAAAAAAQTPVAVVLRDGATGVGAVMWVGLLSCPVNGTASLVNSYMNIAGTTGNAMTLEFVTAPVGTAFESVSLGFYQAIK